MFLLQELSEGEKDLFFVCFGCHFLDPACYTVTAKAEDPQRSNSLSADVLEKVSSSQQLNILYLGPAVLDIAGTGLYADSVGEPTSVTATVRDLVSLHQVIKSGVEIEPVLAHAVLRQKDEGETSKVIHQQGGNPDQKTGSRGQSPNKVGQHGCIKLSKIRRSFGLLSVLASSS